PSTSSLPPLLRDPRRPRARFSVLLRPARLLRELLRAVPVPTLVAGTDRQGGQELAAGRVVAGAGTLGELDAALALRSFERDPRPQAARVDAPQIATRLAALERVHHVAELVLNPRRERARLSGHVRAPSNRVILRRHRRPRAEIERGGERAG